MTVGDRAEITGIPGVHEVIATAVALIPAHEFMQVRLAPGTIYGRWRGGDTIAVESWRCRPVLRIYAPS